MDDLQEALQHALTLVQQGHRIVLLLYGSEYRVPYSLNNEQAVREAMAALQSTTRSPLTDWLATLTC